MILIVHNHAKKLRKVLKTNLELKAEETEICAVFWEMAEKFPGKIIAWCEEKYISDLNLDQWPQLFHQDLIMASYAIENSFLPESIGYVDQLPFVNVNRKVLYPTWLMSSDVGGIKGETLLKFKPLLEGINNLEYLLNSIAKIGQQNGLFCYSAPGLVNPNSSRKPQSTATSSELFSFVYQYYNTIWISVLFLCYWKYEKKFPLMAYIKAFFKKKCFSEKVDLASIKIQSNKKSEILDSIDVIIPTMGRPRYLMQVIEDLSFQTLPPKKVVVIEQNQDVDSISELAELYSKSWPFEIVHKFIHQTGACNARNMALKEVNSNLIFFADDDIRLDLNLLENVKQEIIRYRISAINLNCRQPEEETVFHKVKQWGSFGAGTSVVKSIYAKQCEFTEVFEFGFGEDADFGMQLRNLGCDIIYHPDLQTLHLKAPTGGFRKKPILPWELEEITPKPSPTLMAYAFMHNTPEQIKGSRISLFLKFYRSQQVKNPVRYLHIMRKRWKLSEEWAKKLLTYDNITNKSLHSS